MEDQSGSKSPNIHLVWIYAGPLSMSLSAATRIEPTRILRRLGWHVTMINACSEDEKQIRGVDVVCLPTIDRYFLRQLVFHMRAILFLRKLKPPADIILFHQDSGMWILPLIFLRNIQGKRRPLYMLDIRSVHMPDPGRENIRGRLRGFYIRSINELANRWADGQTAVTKRIADMVHVPKDKLWGIWTNGVDLKQFAPAASARHWPAKGSTIELIYIGSMEYERKLMEFCIAVEKVNANGMSFHLTLLGDGLQREELERYALETEGRITVLRTVPYEQVVDYLARAHLGVLPFPDEEKFRVSSPVKLFEYLAAGLVILATRIVCHTDVIGDSPCVFWAESSAVDDFVEALEQVWKERAGLPQMGSQALLAARAYSWEESTMALKTAMEKGLGRGTDR